MEADHNIKFPRGVLRQPFCNQPVVAFGSANVNIGMGFLPGSMISSSAGIDGTTGMIVAGNSGMFNNISPVVSGSVFSVNAKHRSAFSVDWTYEELQVLKEGLASHPGELNIMMYIKIAAKLPDKTVRDVAMRCRWMTKKENGKRRKPEDFFLGKKINYRKNFVQEKMIGPFSMVNVHDNQQESAAAHSVLMYDGNRSNQFSCQAAPVIDSRMQHLLDDNVQLFHQIAVNLENNEIQRNIDLLYRSKENLITILNSMSRSPGIMSHMPSLSTSVDEELLDSILPSKSQLRAPVNNHFKEESRCW